MGSTTRTLDGRTMPSSSSRAAVRGCAGNTKGSPDTSATASTSAWNDRTTQAAPSRARGIVREPRPFDKHEAMSLHGARTGPSNLADQLRASVHRRSRRITFTTTVSTNDATIIDVVGMNTRVYPPSKCRSPGESTEPVQRAGGDHDADHPGFPDVFLTHPARCGCGSGRHRWPPGAPPRRWRRLRGCPAPTPARRAAPRTP